MTRQNIIDEIRQIIYNGPPNDDAVITPEMVNLHLNEAIAMSVKKTFADSYQIDAVGNIPDGFYITYGGLKPLQDPVTKYYTLTLPQVPLSLPRGQSISNAVFYSLSNIKKEGSRISPREIALMFEVPLDTDEIYYWVEQKTMYIWSAKDISSFTAFVRMAYSQNSDMSSEINCPDDMLANIKQYCLQILMTMHNNPINLGNEGRDFSTTKAN